MECNIRKWRIEDATELSIALNNKNIQDNLRDGLPYPYTKNDAKEFINTMLNADVNTTYAFAITVDNKVVGSIGVFRMDNNHSRAAEMSCCVAEDFW